MSDPWLATGQSKSEAMAGAVNSLLAKAVILSSRGDGKVANYFEVGVFGYGGGVRPILAGSDSGHLIIPVEQLAHNPLRVDSATLRVPDDGGGFRQVNSAHPVWVEPKAYGAAPMVGAFSALEPVVASWCESHPSSFPPIVINITGGKSTDGDPREAGNRIRNLRTEDGPALLFNVHLSGGRNRPLYFPNSNADIFDSEAAILYELSSELPMPMREAAATLGYSVSDGARGFVYNSDELAATDLLEIGTRSVTPTGLHELVSSGRSAQF
ncbi:VWA domain-containing protein [Nocardia sp. MW-W600-9]